MGPAHEPGSEPSRASGVGNPAQDACSTAHPPMESHLPTESFIDPLIALGLGLLVGLQRERTAPPIAGFKTFGLASLLGAVVASVSADTGPWLLAAGLLAVLGVMAIGNAIQIRSGDATPGQTTEVAILVMYMVGALTVMGSTPVAIVIGGAVAVLLHLREELKGAIMSMTDRDLRAIMQFALVSLVILPVLPNRTFGPFDVLNPRNIWLMVVLIVGLNLAGYAAFRWLSSKSGTAVAGLLGGVISSTATTFAYARNTQAGTVPARASAAIIWIASSVVYIRVMIEIGAVAPRFLMTAAGPLLLMLGLFVVLAALTWNSAAPVSDTSLEPRNPTQLRAAVVFGALYAGILFAIAAAESYLGSAGLYATALISGLADIDAITLSTSRMVAAGRLDADVGWRLIVAASLSNMVFKLGIAWVLGGRVLGRRLGMLTAVAIGGGTALILLWG
jgi:uncharacterized membrane protein (DUF4010 family)